MIVPNKPYAGLPANMEDHHFYYKDTGHVIMCIPLCFRSKAKQNPDDWEVGVPARYVLTHTYIVEGDYIYIDVPYSDVFGVDVPDDFIEF